MPPSPAYLQIDFIDFLLDLCQLYLAHCVPRLLIFCTESSGGLADYAHSQAEAIAKLGMDVTLLAPVDFIHRSLLYSLQPELRLASSQHGSRLMQRFMFLSRLLAHARCLAATIRGSGFQIVLFTSYSEYLAPLWAWRFRRLRRLGVRFAAIVHDPVRNYQVGPRWWHRFSIAEGYSFLDHAFVHTPIVLETVRPMPALKVSVIPHGPFPFPVPDLSPLDARKQLGIPADVPLLLCFGRLRDDKNLARVLEALSTHPTAHLLIAGPEATPGQTPSSDYQRLADRLGVQDRSHWRIAFQSPDEVSVLFRAADAVVLAYSASFRSASGVMNVVAQFGLPVLASGGDSALVQAVQQYQLGVVVPPDDTAALSEGLQRLLSHPERPDWQQYRSANSWEMNARMVASSIGLLPAHA
jgi:glycosyltransferase involved in cell wall biosynthesis